MQSTVDRHEMTLENVHLRMNRELKEKLDDQ